MKLTNAQLRHQIKMCVRGWNQHHRAMQKIVEHCVEVYGAEPGDVDADEIIDTLGGCGMASEIPVEDFDRIMKQAVER